MLKNKKIGFLGAGNMAEAILRGLISSNSVSPKDILASDISVERLDFLRSQFKIKTTQDNLYLAEKSDILILAVKPQSLETVCLEIRDHLNPKKLILSLAAGISIKMIEKYLIVEKNQKMSVIRTMPNTPALVLEGVTALSIGSGVSKNEAKIAHKVFHAIGKTVEVGEEQMDAVTGLSGSGPAYIFLMMEALSDAGVKMGLKRDVANLLTYQTVLGAAKLAIESELHPGDLKNRVTSPGGTTIYGVHALEKHGLRNAMIEAVEQATKRSRELGEEP